MRWLRPEQQLQVDDESLEPIARSLDVAAHAAPPSPRAGEIRTALLRDLETSPRASATWTTVALAAAVLALAILVGVGAPAIGSFVGDLLDGDGPSLPVLPDPSVPADDRSRTDPVRTPMPTPQPLPTPPVPVPNQPIVVPTPPVPAPITPPANPPTEAPDDVPTGPPDALPTPPMTGPPSWAPVP